MYSHGIATIASLLPTALGDAKWRELLDRHDEAARREIEVSQGRLIKTTGDGIVATFDGSSPTDSSNCLYRARVSWRGPPPPRRASVPSTRSRP